MTTNPQTDRRDRYAAALYATLEVSPTRHPWETLSPLRRAVWYVRADAAMGLADTELAAVSVPASAPTDQAALIDLAAQAIRDSNSSPEALEWWRTHPQLIPAHVYAAAVLAVLPAPADRAAIEAAAYRAAANYVRGNSADERYGQASISTAMCTVADELYRWAAAAASGSGRVADETQAPVDSRELCPGFPDRCPNLRTVEPEPGVHLGGIRCGCADEQSAVVSQPDGEQRCPAKHGALGRICELPTGHHGMHTGSGPNGGAVWDGDAP